MPGLTVKYLRCEYKVNPAGIDLQKPRFSWIVETSNLNETGLKQNAYHIVISSSVSNINKGISDIWDSGKVLSDRNFQVEYNGKELQSAKQYWWKVKIWSDDIESGWSEPAKFITGIFYKYEWRAKWIGFNGYKNELKEKTKYKFDKEDNWIWLSSANYPLIRKFNEVQFRYSFDIRSVSDIEDAVLLVTADEGFKLFLNDTPAAESDGKIFSWARPAFVKIKHLLQNGCNKIYVECINSYLDKPGFASKIYIIYKNGTEEIIRTNRDWQTSPAVEKNIPDWDNADIIAKMGEKPWRVPHHELILPPPLYLRKEFCINRKIKNAFLVISALGLVKAYLNGKSISVDQFIPGWIDYNKRVYYKMYDVKEFLGKNNSIGIILADGWYAGYIGWERHRDYYGNNPCCMFQIMIDYEDGSNDIIVSDGTWKVSYGPIREADILMGEKYDATLEKYINEWTFPGYNDAAWKSASVEEINIEVNSHPGEPVRQIQEISTKNIFSPKKDVYIFDLGQNIAGCAKLKINGRKTNEVILRYGEVLDNNGELYTDNIRMARASDTYKTKGVQEEVWQPEFTYHGFRYVELTGYPEKPGKDAVTGVVTHSDLPVTGSFICSNDKVNRLYKNIMWSQKANYFDLPTDCPQRDERLGWTADAIDFFKTAAYNMDVSAFYTKWLQDLNDAQQPDGAYTAIAPLPDLGVGPLYSGAAGWADAGIITPYYLYMYYADKSILKRYYPNMIKYMQYLERNSKDFIRPDEGYGDWLSINADTPKDLIATAFYAYDAKLMSEISRVLNEPESEQKYSFLFKRIKNAFSTAYLLQDNTYKTGTQTAYALALSFDLLDETAKNKAVSALVNDIKIRGYHISAGFIGLQFIMPLLSKYGCTDVAYKILLNESFPSWLNMINNGATTMWERWDSYTPEKGIYDPLMNSFNHTSLGVVGEWLYSVIGGISPLEPGFKKIKIQPEPGGGLTYADTCYYSISGKISTSWKYSDKAFILKVIIPFNTTAEVILLKKYGILVKTEPALTWKESENKYKLFIGSGEYTFVMR